MLELVRYIRRNPVRAGLVDRVDRYRWSSGRAYRSGSRHWAWLDRYFVRSVLGAERENQGRAYRQFMSEPDSEDLSSLFVQKRIPSLLGSKEFIDRLKAKLHNISDHPEIPESKILSPEIDSIKMPVCAAYKIDGSGLLWSRRGTTNEARNVAIYLCRRLSCEALPRDVRLRKRVARLEQQLRKAHNQPFNGCPPAQETMPDPETSFVS